MWLIIQRSSLNQF